MNTFFDNRLTGFDIFDSVKFVSEFLRIFKLMFQHRILSIFIDTLGFREFCTVSTATTTTTKYIYFILKKTEEFL